MPTTGALSRMPAHRAVEAGVAVGEDPAVGRPPASSRRRRAVAAMPTTGLVRRMFPAEPWKPASP